MHIKGLKKKVKGRIHAITVADQPAGKRVQVFVFSQRSKMYYPQKPLDGDTGIVVLGDAAHKRGRYIVSAVALTDKAKWTPVCHLPDGTAVSRSVARIGF